MPLLKIKQQGSRPSRFLVNLQKQEEKKEPKQSREQKFLFPRFFLRKQNYIIFLLNLLKKLSLKTLSIYDFFRKNRRCLASSGRNPVDNEYLFSNNSRTSHNTSESPCFTRDNIKKLAFYPFFVLLFKIGKRLFKIAYNVSYNVGWFTVFIVRFIYFSLIYIARSLKNLFSLEKFKNKKLIEVEEININTHKAPNLSNKQIFKKVFIFLIIAIIIISPFGTINYYRSLNLDSLRGRVLGASVSALDDLKNAQEKATKMNFEEASNNFKQAQEQFLTAQNELNKINGFLFVLADKLPNQTVKMAAQAKLVLKAGEFGSELGYNLSQAIASLLASSTLDKRLEDFSFYLNQTTLLAKHLDETIKKIDLKALPSEYREKFVLIKDNSRLLEKSLEELSRLTQSAKILLGFNTDKRYLLVFQNNAEARATGGFIGSYALVDFRRGKIVNLEVPSGGSYDTEAGMQEMISSPEPLRLIKARWYFWDANWWPDWPQSARQLMSFYEKSGGSTVDGVISLTPTVVENFLDIIGPIDMGPDYNNLILSRDNFWLETQKIAENKDYLNCLSRFSSSTEATTPEQLCQDLKPKKIIGDLAQKIITELPSRLNKKTLLQLLRLFNSSLGEKQILFYFRDPSLEKELVTLGWDGAIKNTDYDYLAVINTNIGGGKSDRKIKQEITHYAEVSPDGTIIDTLKIKRIHTATTGEEFVGVRNVDWLRVYVPAGSELLEANGFVGIPRDAFEKANPSWQIDNFISAHEAQASIHEKSGTHIYSEFGKTVFANWSQVDPGQTTIIYLKYKLPFKIKTWVKDQKNIFQKIFDKIVNYLNPNQKELAPYALLIQKQPGAPASTIKSLLKLPQNFKIIWHYPQDEKQFNSDGWKIIDKLNEDKYWAVMFSRN